MLIKTKIINQHIADMKSQQTGVETKIILVHALMMDKIWLKIKNLYFSVSLWKVNMSHVN